MKTIYIDECGHVCPEVEAKYKLQLNGTYRYSDLHKGYWHGVERSWGITLSEWFNTELIV